MPGHIDTKNPFSWRKRVVASLIHTTYSVEGFREAPPPRDLHFLVVYAGFAGTYH
jgi:hypothetical protein